MPLPALKGVTLLFPLYGLLHTIHDKGYRPRSEWAVSRVSYLYLDGCGRRLRGLFLTLPESFLSRPLYLIRTTPSARRHPDTLVLTSRGTVLSLATGLYRTSSGGPRTGACAHNPPAVYADPRPSGVGGDSVPACPTATLGTRWTFAYCGPLMILWTTPMPVENFSFVPLYIDNYNLL